MVTSQGAPHILLAFTLVLAAPPLPLAARHSESICLFPERWQGTWFQSGVRLPITILLNRFSTKGRCIASKEDKFLIANENGNCFRCVSIHEVHENVLQYKETFCSPVDSLSLCSQITGDALLYSMFRQNAIALPCPFTGYHTFFYNRGHGECNTLASTMEPCTQDSRLLLRYQACPDVSGSESAVEELQCLATWKEGSSRYLVGKIEHGHVTSNEDRYRCFVYDKIPPSSGSGDGEGNVAYRVAQSGDATCNGLFSPMEGSRTMTLYKASSPSRCKFPSWVSNPGHWHTLDHRRSYSLRHRNSTLRIADSDGREETRVQCSEVKGPLPAIPGSSPSDNMQIVGHYTVGCQSGYVCMVFYKRDQHVIEVQSGTFTRRFEEACNKSNFDRFRAPFVTLVTTSPDLKSCPHSGRFAVTGIHRHVREERSTDNTAITGTRGGNDEEEILSQIQDCPLETVALSSACSERDTMEVRSECDIKRIVSAYRCHAGWIENGTGYVIMTPVGRSGTSGAGAGAGRRYCFIYTSPGGATSLSSPSSQSATGHVVRFSTSADTCSRTVIPGSTGVLAFNITHQGMCVETSGGSALTMQTAGSIVCLSILCLQFGRVFR
ncbi:Hypothetical protein NTJ_15118 [Nesidiocoris tenuis]|uniref:Uncharacterized protein n=1 Tax=Nesidiocoris tenuis TaxID=355587 RepID=A0ABN7BGG6_9HEMI|nr:Hypothetical protein NTJ_15118 [Nesidiocoris tenuis]